MERSGAPDSNLIIFDCRPFAEYSLSHVHGAHHYDVTNLNKSTNQVSSCTTRLYYVTIRLRYTTRLYCVAFLYYSIILRYLRLYYTTR